MLILKTTESQKKFVYTIGDDGPEVTLIFIDGKFDKCHFPMSGKYSRDDWRVLAKINDLIGEIEEGLK